MHEDEYREAQKQEVIKLMCWMLALLLMLAFWALAYKGLICMIKH